MSLSESGLNAELTSLPPSQTGAGSQRSRAKVTASANGNGASRVPPSKKPRRRRRSAKSKNGEQVQNGRADRSSATGHDAETESEQPSKTWKEYIAALWYEYRDAFGTYTVSTLFHAVIALILALILIPPEDREGLLNIISTIAEEEAEQEELDIEEFVPEPEEEPENLEVDENPIDVSIAESVTESETPFEFNINDLAPTLVIEDHASFASIANIKMASELGGRSKAVRGALLKMYGGTPESEAAVVAGLKWLVRHQNPDGSWSFDHRRSACGEYCTLPGSLKNCQMGATSMALLAFLGAGHTHHSGDYQPQVQNGLRYLLYNMKPDGDLRAPSGQGNMYVQGLGAIALCEAFAMVAEKYHEKRTSRRTARTKSRTKQKDSATKSTSTADKKKAAQAKRKMNPRLRTKNLLQDAGWLQNAAQKAVNFIILAQDKRGGGWRYRPGKGGDTSVVGWQVMALQSARASKLLVVPQITLDGATHFLNSVQTDYGSKYGYTKPGSGLATTSIGLLCRMYLGWGHESEALAKGVSFLGSRGPSKSMYHNYYATQVLHHWGGEEWTKWNEVMREQLISTQAKAGHAEGSWSPAGDGHHGGSGGRLYTTCMSIMTLEVYYRHLPLYTRASLAVELP